MELGALGAALRAAQRLGAVDVGRWQRAGSQHWNWDAAPTPAHPLGDGSSHQGVVLDLGGGDAVLFPFPSLPECWALPGRRSEGWSYTT